MFRSSQKLVFDTVYKRLPTCLYHGFRRADSTPRVFPVTGRNEHARPGGRTIGGSQRPHFIVKQPYILEAPAGKVLRQHRAERFVQGIHGAVAPGSSMLDIPSDLNGDGGLAYGVRVNLAFFSQDTIIDPVEYFKDRFITMACTQHEQFERSFSPLELVALVLELFDLPEDLKRVYTEMKLDLPRYNGDDSWQLPMPARFVIDRQGIMRYADFDPDYTTRPDPEETLAVLRKMSGA